MYNEVILMGWVGRPAPLQQPGNGGKRFATTSLCTKRRWYDLDGVQHEKLTWHTIEAWEDRALILSETHKGDVIFINGYIENEVYENKFHSAVIAQKIIRVFTQQQGQLVTLRSSLQELVKSLDDHQREILFQLLKEALGRN